MRELYIALALALSAQPALAIDLNRVVLMNGTLKHQFFTSLNPDCSLMAYPSITLIESPSNGKVSYDKGKAFPNFAPQNPLSACNTQRVPGLLIEYRPARDFIGADSFSLDVISPDGSEKIFKYNITIK